jgi:creatinine amidohydrolase
LQQKFGTRGSSLRNHGGIRVEWDGEVPALRWSDIAWPEVGQTVDLGAEGRTQVALVPVGATEQHGPHLPLGTDTIVATALCERASEACGAPVLPAIPVGCSYGHSTDLPGTLSLAPEQLAMLARQWAEWAATSGLTRVLFVNAHFGNAAPLGMATDHLRLFRPDLRVGVVNWWSLDPTVAAESVLDGDDLHANRSETSVMLHLAPELVHVDRMADADDPDRTADLVFRYTAPALSTNGVTGRPSEATEELGQKLVDLTVAAIVDRVERGRSEEPPLGVASQPTVPIPSP